MKNFEEMNLFMVANNINKNAFCDLPQGFHIRNLKVSELDYWKSMPFDGDYKQEYKQFMDNYFNDVYKARESEFFKNCKVVCNDKNEIVSTCFLWKVFDNIITVHWFKTLKEYEGKKIGRALLSYLFKNVKRADFPILLHTQAGSFRAVKLYGDFGFQLVTNKKVGNRDNHLEFAKNYLKKVMPSDFYNNLKYIELDNEFLSKIGNQDVF